MKHDFNLVDSFRIFDRQNLGCIYKEDLVNGLKMNLDFFEFSSDDIYMLFKRIDKQGLGRITFKQFNDIILPIS